MGKVHINTSYNPYNGGFTPYGANAHTPTGNNSQGNTPNPGNSNGFRFSVCFILKNNRIFFF